MQLLVAVEIFCFGNCMATANEISLLYVKLHGYCSMLCLNKSPVAVSACFMTFSGFALI